MAWPGVGAHSIFFSCLREVGPVILFFQGVFYVRGSINVASSKPQHLEPAQLGGLSKHNI